MWEEESVKEKEVVGKFFNLLTTAFGLSVCEDDSKVVLCDIDNIFAQHSKNDNNEKETIDKDVC